MSKTTAVALNSKTALNKLKKEVMDEFLTSNQEVYKAGLRSLTIQEQKYNQQIEAIRADITKLHEARGALDAAFLAGELHSVTDARGVVRKVSSKLNTSDFDVDMDFAG